MHETAPTGLEWNLQHAVRLTREKHDTRLLIGRIAFLTCGKSDTRHLIGLHRIYSAAFQCVYNNLYVLPKSRTQCPRLTLETGQLNPETCACTNHETIRTRTVEYWPTCQMIKMLRKGIFYLSSCYILICPNGPYSYSWYWTGTSLKLRLMRSLLKYKWA